MRAYDNMIPEIHRKRVSTCINIWSELLNNEIKDRGEAVKLLKYYYESNNVEPLRGKTKIDIFDKEMITLYVVGKYGLGLDPKEYKDVYEKIFYKELKFEEAYYRILKGENSVQVLMELFNTADENTVFRVIRLSFTAVILGFDSEENLINLLNKIADEMPHLRHRINGFIKFYIAFKVAEKVVSGEIKNRIEKEALKHSLCVKFNAIKNAPPDTLIKEIAINVLKGEEYKVNRAFKVELDISLNKGHLAQ